MRRPESYLGKTLTLLYLDKSKYLFSMLYIERLQITMRHQGIERYTQDPRKH